MMSQEPPPPPRVLVVEDEIRVAQMIAEVLEAEGYEVDTAANGLLALEKIQEHDYDLILSDLRMPELDGLGLYRELERRKPTLLSRFLFVSGTMDLPEYRRFLAETAVAVLAKPFALVDLQRVTRQMLSAHRREPERA
jgi:CheY-like chemotaxis protein